MIICLKEVVEFNYQPIKHKTFRNNNLTELVNSLFLFARERERERAEYDILKITYK
jgi:hypothetical protein